MFGEIGWAFLLGALAFNAVTYYGGKLQYETYTYVMSFIEGMLNLNQIVPKELEEELRIEKDTIENGIKHFKKVFRFSKVIYSGQGIGGDMTELFKDYIRMFTHIDVVYCHYQIEKIIAHRSELIDVMEKLGYIESLLSVATYRNTLDDYCIPKIIEETNQISAENLYHPLIEAPVSNSIVMLESILITGSNASGKSTFIKTMALNLIMAQSICTCTASCFESGLYKVFTSMTIRDDLLNMDSYYIAEIKALKRILDLGNEEKVFCCIDEILRGTNTIERIAAAAHILKFLKENHKLCMAATHDIELTYMLEELYENYHFCESCNEKNVQFDYRLKQGRCLDRNALKMLDSLGVDKIITRGAELTAANFERTKVWGL